MTPFHELAAQPVSVRANMVKALSEKSSAWFTYCTSIRLVYSQVHSIIPHVKYRFVYNVRYIFPKFMLHRKANVMTRTTSAKDMKIGIVLDTVEGALQGKTPTFRELQGMAQAAERAGLDSIWLNDHLIY